MSTRTLIGLLGFFLLSACASVPYQESTLISTKNGKEQYAVGGVAIVHDVFDGCTKPYVEKGMSAICPNGLRYLEFFEAPGKQTDLVTWMGWRGKVECK